MFCQTICGGFCRCCFQVIQFSVFFLIIGQPFSHMIQNIFCKLLCLLISHVCTKPSCIQSCFIHANQTDGGKMIVKASQIALGIRIQPLIQQFSDHFSLDMQGTCGNIHQAVQTLIKFILILRQISDPWHIDGYHAHRTGAFAGTEVSSGLFTQFSQIQTQTTAHTSYIAWLHIAVNIVGKIRSSVFGCHLKEQTVVFCIGPVKFFCDGVSRNRILETSAIGISFDHGLDKRLVDHIHLLFTVFILKVHLFSANDCRKFCQIIRYSPVQCDIGKWSLCSPATWCVHTIDKGFDTFFHFRISQMVCLYERCQISIKRRKSLCTCPFILHDAKEIDHLVTQNTQVFRRSGSNLAFYSS